MVPVVLRAPTKAVANATAGHVSRPQGSPMTLSLGNLGSCFLTAAACVPFVMTKIFLIGIRVLILSMVC